MYHRKKSGSTVSLQVTLGGCDQIKIPKNKRCCSGVSPSISMTEIAGKTFPDITPIRQSCKMLSLVNFCVRARFAIKFSPAPSINSSQSLRESVAH